jgi:uncharacterized spore protein YtfJ
MLSPGYERERTETTMTEQPATRVTELAAAAREALTVRRLSGEPYERDGVTVIHAAVLRGGVGLGGGAGDRGQHGEGGGFGVVARPAGAYVIKDGEVAWRPALDLNRTIGLAAAAAVGLSTIGRRRGAGTRGRFR